MGEFKIGGVFEVEHIRDGVVIDKWQEKNVVTNEGLDHLLNVHLANVGSQVTTWYVGLIESGSSPTANSTMATPIFTECSNYTEANRVTYDVPTAGAANQSLTNGSGTGANKATFTMNATKTITGAFLSSNNTKGGTAGTLFSASDFSANRSVVNTDVLNITYTIQTASA